MRCNRTPAFFLAEENMPPLAFCQLDGIQRRRVWRRQTPYGDFPQTICPDPSDESHFALSQIRETVWWQYERSENQHFETGMSRNPTYCKICGRLRKKVGDWEKKWAIEKKKTVCW